MKLNEYVNLAVKTESTGYEAIAGRLNSVQVIRLLHAFIGLSTELGELQEAYLKFLSTGTVDEVNLREELGDLCWYTAIAMDELGITDVSNYGHIERRNSLSEYIHVIGVHTNRCLDLLKKSVYYGKPLNEEKMCVEVINSFLALTGFSSFLGVKLESVMERNIEKLRARYGDKFTEDRAINRNLDTERSILEK